MSKITNDGLTQSDMATVGVKGKDAGVQCSQRSTLYASKQRNVYTVFSAQ